MPTLGSLPPGSALRTREIFAMRQESSRMWDKENCSSVYIKILQVKACPTCPACPTCLAWPTCPACRLVGQICRGTPSGGFARIISTIVLRSRSITVNLFTVFTSHSCTLQESQRSRLGSGQCFDWALLHNCAIETKGLSTKTWQRDYK